MTDPIPTFPARHACDPAFFAGFALLFATVLAFGFLPDLPARVAGTRDLPAPVVHVHAVLFYGWATFFAIQVGFVRIGRSATHRTLGIFGVVLAAAIIAVGVTMSLTLAIWHYERGSPRQLGFLIVPLSDMFTFGVLICAAILKRTDGAAHKRLMVLASTVLMGAAFGRMEMIDLDRLLAASPIRFLIEVYGPLIVISTLAALYDLLTRGRVHSVFLWAMPFILAVQALSSSMVDSHGWRLFAKAALGLT